MSIKPHYGNNVAIDVRVDMISETNLRIGLDTGGTYTDLALVDDTGKLVYRDKTLTTHKDLVIGIHSLLKRLPDHLRIRCSTLALSTTLATNAVVEQRGSHTVLLLSGFASDSTKKAGLEKLLLPSQIHYLEGQIDALGNVKEKLTDAHIMRIADNLGNPEAIAVTGMFATRNPVHERRIKSVLKERHLIPIILGSELSASLGAFERAVTASLNASMLGMFHHFINAVRSVLEDSNLNVEILIMKGDGVLTPLKAIEDYPVSTVLSGPAASILSVAQIRKSKSAITVDVGGTTSDIGLIISGNPSVTQKGARVGPWTLKVPSVRMRAVGLGFDSEVGFNGVDGICIESRRVLPLSLAALTYPQINEVLEERWSTGANATDLRFAIVHSPSELHQRSLSDQDQKLIEMAHKKPLDVRYLNESAREQARRCARLVRKGVLIYTGMTLTDAAHVLGYCNHFNKEASLLAAKLWERMVYQVYGCRQWSKGDEKAACRRVFQVMLEKLCLAIEELLLWHDDDITDTEISQLLRLRKRIGQTPEKHIQMKINPDLEVVLTGKPAPMLAEHLQQRLGLKVTSPEFADVANAYGVACGNSRIHHTVEITQQQIGVYRVHAPNANYDYTNADQAMAKAQKTARSRVLELAGLYGLQEPQVDSEVVDHSAYLESGECIFFSACAHAHIKATRHEA